MASKPGAEELDIFSGDSEEDEKNAVEALTQMLRDDPLADQQTSTLDMVFGPQYGLAPALVAPMFNLQQG